MLFKGWHVDISFKLSSREFHSLMADAIHNFCEILVLLRGTDMFLLFLRSGPDKMSGLIWI